MAQHNDHFMNYTVTNYWNSGRHNHFVL